MFISIAIPSYNRPETLIELLQSIDFFPNDIEIVICEDCSPRRNEIKDAVTSFKSISALNIQYFENAYNLGYDANLWELIKRTQGDYVIYMGDDDEFIPGALVKFYNFLKSNAQLGYVMKSHIAFGKDNSVEYYKYYKSTCFFEKGEKSIVELLRKSVLISGFCIKRDGLLEYYTNYLNGTLLIQLFFLAIQCLKYDSAYFETPLTKQQDKNTIPYFGSSEIEKELYIPGEKSVSGSLNFLAKFNVLFDYIDNTLHLNVKSAIKKDMSKYIYPTLAVHRDKGIRTFSKYTISLSKLGFNSSIYFYFYYLSLLVLGKRNCDKIIIYLKSKLTHTPHL